MMFCKSILVSSLWCLKKTPDIDKYRFFKMLVLFLLIMVVTPRVELEEGLEEFLPTFHKKP